MASDVSDGRATGSPEEGAPPLHGVPGRRTAAPSRARRPVSRAGALLPTPTGTPFTFFYTLVLVATSLYARFGDPDTVAALLRGSSTDAAHLFRTPLLVLVASALWIAGGLASPYALGFVLVLTALERRVGGVCTAGVFLAGHVVATLATEVPVGLSVLAGRLPESSLHRLDYGISFGLLACVGALAGLLRTPARTALLGGTSLVLVRDLLVFEDPLSNWGHPLALLAGITCWSVVRRRAAPRAPGPEPAGAPRPR